MANTLATLEQLCNNGVNRLCNGDFIDLTSEGEPQKTGEDDVVLVDGSNGEDQIPLPIGSSRSNNSSVTQQAASFIVRKEDYKNITTKQFMVPSRVGGNSGSMSKNLVSASDPPGPKKDVVTITLLPNSSEQSTSALNSSLQKASNKTKNTAKQQSLVANTNSPRVKSVTPKKPRVNVRKSLDTPSGSAPKIRVKNCVLLPSSSEVGNQNAKQKPAPPERAKGPNKPVYYILTPKGSVPASEGPVLASKGPVQVPQKSQTKVISSTTPMRSSVPVNVIKQSQFSALDKNTSQLRVLDKNTGQLRVLDKNTTQLRVLDKNTGQLRVLDKNTSQLRVLDKNTGQLRVLDKNTGQLTLLDTNPSQLRVLDKNTGQLTLLDTNPNQLRVLDKNTGQLTLLDTNSCQMTVLDKNTNQLTVLDKNAIMRLQKNIQNNVLFLTPKKSAPLKRSTVQNPNLTLPSLSESPTKSYTASKNEITTMIQHVQVIEDEESTVSQEESQRIDVPPNFLINNEKDDVVGLFVYPFTENDPSLLTVPQSNDELEDTQLMEIVEEDEEMVIENHEEVSQSNEIKDELEDVQIIETIEDDDEEEVIIDSKEGILIESEKNDPLDDLLIESPSLVTPVDIDKILNEANLRKAKAVEDRCKCNYMKNQIYMYRGFTRREMRKPTCYKYLQTLIKLNEAKIKDLKKSIASYEENFIHCGGTLNYFLPEGPKCEDYDSDEYTIEYSRLDTTIQSLQIPSVISKVNEQVKALESKRAVNKKTPEEIKATLAEPEEALKLIQKGLELIRIWKDKANKSLPVTSTKRSVPVVATRKAKSIESKPVTVPSPAKTAIKTRGRKKPEINTPQEATEVGKRNRKPKKQLDDEPVATEVGKRKRKPKNQLDDELVIKKQMTDNRNKVETFKAVKTATNVETKPTRRRRKKQTDEYNDPDPNDNELFVIKKIDILNDKRKRRK